MSAPKFEAGVNIAMKIPKAQYDATVAFYRDTLGLPVTEHASTGAATVAQTHAVEFGPVTLWLDRVDAYSQADLWLELRTDDLPAATTHLAEVGIAPCDVVLVFVDPDTPAHWIRNPAGIIHLLAQRPAEPASAD
jgi:catechol 2,3-dioxygenase-like lactoylglutathione lyase family enzyme